MVPDVSCGEDGSGRGHSPTGVTLMSELSGRCRLPLLARTLLFVGKNQYLVSSHHQSAILLLVNSLKAL